MVKLENNISIMLKKGSFVTKYNGEIKYCNRYIKLGVYVLFVNGMFNGIFYSKDMLDSAINFLNKCYIGECIIIYTYQYLTLNKSKDFFSSFIGNKELLGELSNEYQ